MTPEQLKQYLDRVGLNDAPQVSESGLTTLQNAQHRRIPFENMDVAVGKKIELSEKAIFEKLITNNRGGYCFEVNGLMLRALEAFGFEAKPLLGRVHLAEQPSGRSHQVSLVTLDGKEWLVDVGFGSQTPRQPLPVVLNTELVTDMQTFRLIEDAQFGIMLQIKEQDAWLNLYSLDMAHVCSGDIEMGNHYTCTSPNSVFTSNCTAAMPNDKGIVTLLNDTLKIKTQHEVQEITLEDEASYQNALKVHFGIELDVDFKDLARHF
ncbi:N-hydroxyarylamine O-acetyltransferase [Vibrio ishigakensis]|uniref:N-hydroxyarylamine O-acetyltransferase n=1 Tax=Vibrio ishigakensis TaxID=1481914 RepID=A0A0B8QHF4_9VIBR|nr:N-hydroxyarylamine O-acetyltransferase [Vibrio ishigakensis]